MNILLKNGLCLDPSTGMEAIGDVAISAGKIAHLGSVPSDFQAEQSIDATGLIVCPGLVDASVHIGSSHILESELRAAVAGGVTSVVCTPDTKPVLDEPGLVEMLQFRAEKLGLARLYPLGALTQKLAAENLSEIASLAQAGCVGFAQGEKPISNHQTLLRALQYAATFGHTVWLRPIDAWLGLGVVASGALASRMGLNGVPVAAETIALNTLFALMRISGARVHLCRISSAEGVALVRAAKAEGLAVSCDTSINHIHFNEDAIGYYDSRVRLNPPLRSRADQQALRQGLVDGTIDALVSDHHAIKDDAKILPFAECSAGATGLELLLAATVKWALEDAVPLAKALAVVSQQPAELIGRVASLQVGSAADICVFQPGLSRELDPKQLKSCGKYTPFDFDFCGFTLPTQVKTCIVAGRVCFSHT